MPFSRTTLEGFWPAHCAHDDCIQSTCAPQNGFLRHGHYMTRFAGRRIPRFLCKSCHRTMSSQTFDSTYRLRRPDLERKIMREIAQGRSLRGVAKVLGINRKTVSRRLLRVRMQAEVQVPSMRTQLAAVRVGEPSGGDLL